MQNKYDKYEEEFSLFGLIWFWISRWKSIVAVALIGLIVGCGFVVITAPNANSMEAVEYEASAQLLMAEDLAQFSEERVMDYGAYIIDTKLLDINAYDLYRGSLVYKVEAAQTELDAVYGAIYSFISNGELHSRVEAATGLYSAQDLASLIGHSVFRSNSPVVSDTDVVSHMTLAITVLGADKEEATILLDQVTKELDAYVTELHDAYTITGYTVVDATVTKGIAKVLADYQDELRNKYTTEKDKLKTLKTALNEDSATENASTAVEAGIDKSDLIKYGGVGFVAGLVLALVVWGLIYLFGDKLYAVEKMEEIFAIKSLGVIHDTKKLNPIDRFIAQKRGSVYCSLPVEEQRKIVQLNIKNELKKIKEVQKIYLISSLGENLAEAALLKAELEAAGYSVLDCSNVIGRADILEQMEKTDAVVVLENKDLSKESLVEAELAVLKEYVDNVLGLVMLGGKK